MSEQDDAQKTEDPTPRRLEQGRERGQVAVSQDVKGWAVLAASTLGLAALLPAATAKLMPILTRFLDSADVMTLDPAGLTDGLLSVLLSSGVAVMPLSALIAVAALAAGFGQSGFIFAGERITPSLDRISPIKGFGRLFGRNALVEFAKGLLKLVAVGAVVVFAAVPALDRLDLLPALPVAALADHVDDLILILFAGATAATMVIAGLDYLYQRFAFLRQMRMTQQEVRDEFKETEGDPHVRARIRRIRSERARKRMMAAVPQATVVITNPTHYAVALSYDGATMAAPKVVAKGVDLIAQRIRTVAEQHGVPLIENPPLARSLYAAVDIDEEIPTQHYQAVAEIIGRVLRLGGKAGLGT